MQGNRNLSMIRSFLHRATAARVVLLFVFHAAVFTSCYTFAWMVRFEFNVPPEWIPTLKASLVVVVAIQLVVGALFGFYRGWWRYVGMNDVLRLGAGMSAASALVVVAWYLGDEMGIHARFVHMPRGVILIDWAFALLTLFGARVAIRVGRDRLRPGDASSTARRVLIIGAGDAGEALAREIQHRPQLGMKLAGFVDDQRAKWGSHIRGVNVFGPISDIRAIADSVQADEALLAIPSASGKRMREIIEHVSSAGMPFKTMPGMDQLMSGQVQVTQLRAVNLEDLMRRKQVELPGDPVQSLFTGKRVLVTGAGGTIGAELCSQILHFEPVHLALAERSEFALYEVRKRLSREAPATSVRLSSNLVDINDRDALREVFDRVRPEIVLHAAAHKHVPIGEENPPEYLRNNCVATRKLAEIADEYGAERFVFISTDKAINPTSVMGATKRAAEIALVDLAHLSSMKLTIVRFGNVIGSSGSAIPLFMEQIAAGGPVTVTHPDVTRYFLRTSEAVSLVLQAATLGNSGHVYMLDMGEPVKIADLARDLIRLSNHTEEEIPIVFTGLRPGEKLFEEIRLEGESIRPTVHPQIVITEPPQPSAGIVAAWLAEADGTRHAAHAVELLSRLIPEYDRTEVSGAREAAARPVETGKPLIVGSALPAV